MTAEGMLVYLIKHLSRFFRIVDYFTINFVFFIGKYYFFEADENYFYQDYKAQFVLLNLSWFIATVITKPYTSIKIKESSLHFNALLKAYSLLVVFTAVYLSQILSIKINYGNVLRYFLVIGIIMTLVRFTLFLYRKKNRVRLGRKLYNYNTVLIGENKLSGYLLSNKSLKRLMGIRGVYSCGEKITCNKYLGDVHQMLNDFDNTKISSIIFCDDKIDLEQYKNIVEAAEQKMIRIYMVPEFKYAKLGSYYVEMVQDIPFLKLMKEPLSDPKKQILKRTFDIVFSLLVIVFLLSWLIPLVAIIIKIESNESVFFLQKRSGYKNIPFNCIKFRSMASNKQADFQTAKKNDARVTKFGAFMRKTSIDELPQFFNVFFGDMSVVGPRPHMLSQTDMYSKITKKYMTRHMVKPGITGWAQVMGARGEIFTDKDMERRIEKDIWYIQNWSFFLDMKIIFLTLYNIVRGDEQAY